MPWLGPRSGGRVAVPVAVRGPALLPDVRSRLTFYLQNAVFLSGAEGIRTPDLRRAKAALSQLSYGAGMEGEFTREGCVIQRAPGTLGGYNTVRCMLARGEVDRMALYEYKCAECDGRFD